MNNIFRMTLQYEPTGEMNEITDLDFTVTKTSEDTVYYNCEKFGVQAAIKTTYEGKEKLQSLTITAGDKTIVEKVKFPISRKRLTNYDKLLVSTAWGDMMDHPAQMIQQYCLGKDSGEEKYGWIRAVSEHEVAYMYPSIMSMQYLVVFNQYNSYYLASYSVGKESLSFNITTFKNNPYDLELSVCHYPYVKNGKWESPVCSQAELGAGWYEAADTYSLHMGTKFKNPDLPEWMTDENEGFHGWLATPMKAWGHITCRFSDLPKIYKESVVAAGLNTLHVYGWCNDGHDTLYPNYYPNPELGTVEELKHACEEIKNIGGHIILYTNGRILDPNSEFFKSGGYKDVCIDENGKPCEEVWGPKIHYQIHCPSQTAYHKYMADAVGRIIKEYKANAVQIDQTSCNYGEFCFDKNHNHTKPSDNFLDGLTDELKTIRNTYKSLDKDFFVWCEGCHERFGQYYDVEQGHGEAYSLLHIGTACPEQFKYNYKKRIVSGLALDLQQMCYSFIQGKPFDAKVGKMTEKDYAELISKLVAVRKKYPEIYLNGIYMADKDIDADKYTRCGAILSEDENTMMIGIWKQGAGYESKGNISEIKIPDNYSYLRTAYPSESKVSYLSNGIHSVKYDGPVAAVLFEKIQKCEG